MLKDRETAVLAAVIERYIRTGEPAPSADIARESRLGLSAASIRSVMGLLADLGYLEQPHISAGRVPTLKAYRLYVDTVLAPVPLSARKKQALAQAVDIEHSDIHHVFRAASSVISSHCLQLGAVLAPKRDEMRWRTIEFSPVSSGLVLAVLVVDGGLVHTRMVPVPTEYSQDELARFSNYLNNSYKGCTLSNARTRIETELALAEKRLEQMCRNALALSRPALDAADDREVFMNGIGQVSLSANFATTARLRELLSFMEERPKLLDLLERTLKSSDVSVSFVPGERGAASWAVVSAPYAPAESLPPLGVVSAIGLVHMNYATVLPVVAHIARLVASVMRRRLAIA